MAREVNAAGIALIKSFEGLRTEAYRDQRGIWTLGYGHTRGVAEGDTCTDEQATQWLAEDLALAAAGVDRATVGCSTSDNQFAAMVSLAYNVGVYNFITSSVLAMHRASQYAQAGDAFLMWDKTHIGGKLQPDAGLLRRRQAERTLYLTDDGESNE